VVPNEVAMCLVLTFGSESRMLQIIKKIVLFFQL
jgi:hypothetical protein